MSMVTMFTGYLMRYPRSLTFTACYTIIILVCPQNWWYFCSWYSILSLTHSFIFVSCIPYVLNTTYNLLREKIYFVFLAPDQFIYCALWKVSDDFFKIYFEAGICFSVFIFFCESIITSGAADSHLSPWIIFVRTCADKSQDVYPHYGNVQFFLLSFHVITE